MKKKVVIVLAVTIFARFFGLFREIVLSYFFGLSEVTDAFIIALTIPSVLFLIIGEGINKTLVPVYHEAEEKANVNIANEFVSQLNVVLYVFSTIVVIFTLLFAEQIIGILARGFKGELLELTIRLTRISVFSIYFITSTYILTGYLQIKEKFTIVSLIGVPLNLVNIISIVISASFGEVYLAYGQVAAALAQFTFVLFFAYRNGYSYRIGFSEVLYLKKVIKNAGPVMLGKSVHQVNKLVDKTIASTILIGGVSALTYANRINLLIQNVFVIPISMMMYTELSKRIAKGEKENSKLLQSYLIQTLIIIIPIVCGGFILSELIISVIYGRGEFEADAIKITSSIFRIYLIGAIGFTFRNLLTNVFFAMQNTRTPMINSVISLTLNVLLNILLSRIWGIEGIALATTISILVAAALFYRSCTKSDIVVINKTVLVKIVKIVVAAIFMIGSLVILECSNLIINIHDFIQLAIYVGVGTLLYFLSLHILKVEEIRVLSNRLLEKAKRK